MKFVLSVALAWSVGAGTSILWMLATAPAPAAPTHAAPSRPSVDQFGRKRSSRSAYYVDRFMVPVTPAA